MKIIILFSLFFSLNSFSKKIEEIDATKICNHYKAKKEFKNFDYSCSLIHALIFVESRYKTHDYNPEKTGSYGLMQIQCATAKMVGLKFNCEQLFDPQINIRFGMKYILWLEKTRKIKSIKELIASWNAGKAYLCKHLNKTKKGKVLCYPGQFINHRYVRDVSDHYRYLEEEKKRNAASIRTKQITI